MGNPLLKNYSIEKDSFLTGGFNNLWKIYKGSRKDRKQDVCVFVLEKKSLDKYSKDEREEIFNVLKKEAGALVKFKHPSVLGVVEQVLEDKASLVYVTEPVQYTLSSWIDTSGASKLEIKLMITEICNVISFFHVDAHVIHTCMNPDNIFINAQGHIKLSGLSFSITDPPVSGAELKLNPAYPEALPCMKYIAPEIVFDSTTYYNSDVFSIGMIIYNVLKFHKGDTDRDLLGLNGSNTIDAYKKAYDVMENKLMRIAFENDDNDIICKSLNRSAQKRPTIKELLDHVWFNDPKLKALRFVENLEQNDVNKNVEFLSKFPNILSFFENKIIERKFLPSFLNALKIEALIVNTLPAIFSICEAPSIKIDFEQTVWPSLKNLFQMKQIPAAGLYFLLSKLNFIADKISNSEFSSNMMNIICKALDCGVAKIQTVVLDNLMFIIKKVDSLAFKNQIYPRLVNIILNTNSNSLKISILKCFLSVYSLLDQNILNESLLNTLEKLRKADNNSDVCMNIISIYEEIAKVVSVESIANKILPNLISILVSGNISKNNFEKIMSIVQKYLTRIKESREKDLSDDSGINKLENKENSINGFNSINTALKSSGEKDEINFLDSFFGGNPSSIANSNLNKNHINSINSGTSANSANSNLEFDYINKNLEESTKKSTNPVIKIEPKKEKTIFDGIKDNVPNNGVKSSTNSNLNMFEFNLNGTSLSSTTAPTNNANIFNINSQSTSLNLANKNNNFSNNKKIDPFVDKCNNLNNIDFNKLTNTNVKNNPNNNVLDSLLNDLPYNLSSNANNNNINNNFNPKLVVDPKPYGQSMNNNNMGWDINFNNGMNANSNLNPSNYNMNINPSMNSNINNNMNFNMSPNLTPNMSPNMNPNMNLNINLNTNKNFSSSTGTGNLSLNKKNDEYNLDFLKSSTKPSNNQDNFNFEVNKNKGPFNSMNNPSKQNNINNNDPFTISGFNLNNNANNKNDQKNIFDGLLKF